ncbi:MAG: EamA family transporter [Bacteroidaceae bacterium]|nr:EamA family transporter [Bacteroidales bacterium]MBQ3122169.1 EamA family transporter [Bacteroidaceae bacterium]MBQ3152450.1 EamA family transporter [Bacteroidaceae bacterium]MBQ4037882.1 EamA family transporter [Bacteroidaceae bacterium]
MWVALAFMSAALLGCYDFFKKVSLKDNAVLPVLFLNTLFSALLFLPFILLSGSGVIGEGVLYVPSADLHTHLFLMLKAVIVLSSWICGYFAMKHLPITIVSPIQATRPVMVLLGALLIFGEQLNLYQWIGVSVAIVSFFLLGKSGKREGIDFRRNKWVAFVVAAAMLGAASALYDKFLMSFLQPMLVQSWFNIYQSVIMAAIVLLLWYPTRKKTTPFKWRTSILFISLFLGVADFCYFSALAEQGALIAVVSMIRRGSVLVSFAFGAMVLREKNLKSKVFDLLLILIGLFFLYLGSK